MIATYSTYLSLALKDLKVEVTLLAEYPFPNDSAIDNDFKHDVPYFYCWKRNEPYDKLIEESKNYDILHLQHQFGLFPNESTFIKLLHEAKTPIVTTLHDVIPFNYQMANYFNETIYKSKKIIVHTNPCYNLLLNWNCPKEKIELIPHGTKLIDIPSKEEARKELNLPENAKIILSWGFIWESKGILDLVKIHAEILKTYPEAIFIHAGGVHPIIEGSKYLGNILKTAVKLGLNPQNFMITQWIPEDKVSLWFGASDVIVLNYMRGSASASGAAHRTLSAHKPIIKTDDSCLEDIPGYTVPRFSPSDLYQGIMKVLEDENLQKDLIKQAMEMAQKTSWEKIAKEHIKVYNEIIKKA